jgi:hypothetical protein
VQWNQKEGEAGGKLGLSFGDEFKEVSPCDLGLEWDFVG